MDSLLDRPAKESFMKFDIYSFYKKMEHNDIMLSFKGDITSDLLTSMLQIMETKLDNIEEAPKVKRKVYNVLVECLQNLYHHRDEGSFTDENGQVRRSAIFMISKNDFEYNIVSGNFIRNEKVENVKSRIDKINSLDKAELRELARHVLENDEITTDHGTAGLGFIDIARKSGQKLNYEFLKVDDNFSFFSLYIKIAQ